jgi:hypothetical protein
MKDLKDKGYFTMADGTKSTDHEDPAKKKKAKSETKPGNKRTSAVSAGKAKSAGRPKKDLSTAKKGGKSMKSDDDLDIESEKSDEEALEASD